LREWEPGGEGAQNFELTLVVKIASYDSAYVYV